MPTQKTSMAKGAQLANYIRNAGEVGNRNVQMRREKSFRYLAHPEDTQDIPAGLVIPNELNAPRPQGVINAQLGRNPLENWLTSERVLRNKEKMGFDDGGAIKLRNNVPGIKGNFSAERAAGISLSRGASHMINSPIPGRTDKINMSVPSGSYIIPADIPSAIGEGNSMAGANILNKMFSSGPYGMARGSGPYGMNIQRMHAGNPRTHNRMASLSMFASGGPTGHPTPIVAAGGEYVVHPDAVTKLGAGDIKKGHDVLDAFVKMIRSKHINTLKGLKPPKGSKK